MKKLTVTVAGVTLLIELYAIKCNDFKSRFIYFQDAIENNTHSEEYNKSFGRVASTITFK